MQWPSSVQYRQLVHENKYGRKVAGIMGTGGTHYAHTILNIITSCQHMSIIYEKWRTNVLYTEISLKCVAMCIGLLVYRVVAVVVAASFSGETNLNTPAACSWLLL